MIAASQLIQHFSQLAPRYDVALSDVWGVLHNGVVAFPEASDALSRFRADGGTVILISNAPRPGNFVLRQLDRLGVLRSAYDAIVTSGDLTHSVMASRPGQTVFHLGPPRDRPMFEDLDVRLVTAEEADYIVCSGLYDDEHETPDDYRELLEKLHGRNLLMVCANPDIVVERGDRLVFCAGAIADCYRSLGGDVLYAGKPHRPIYDNALATAASIRAEAMTRDRIIAIGDSIRTDLAGAAAAKIDSLFVTAGIHAEELGGQNEPDLRVLSRIFSEAGIAPKAVMRRLAW